MDSKVQGKHIYNYKLIVIARAYVCVNVFFIKTSIDMIYCYHFL